MGFYTLSIRSSVRLPPPQMTLGDGGRFLEGGTKPNLLIKLLTVVDVTIIVYTPGVSPVFLTLFLGSRDYGVGYGWVTGKMKQPQNIV